MKYTKPHKVKMVGPDRFIAVLWFVCAIIWTANTFIEVRKNNWAGAGLRALLVVVYLFLSFAKYYELKRKQR